MVSAISRLSLACTRVIRSSAILPLTTFEIHYAIALSTLHGFSSSSLFAPAQNPTSLWWGRRYPSRFSSRSCQRRSAYRNMCSPLHLQLCLFLHERASHAFVVGSVACVLYHCLRIDSRLAKMATPSMYIVRQLPVKKTDVHAYLGRTR